MTQRVTWLMVGVAALLGGGCQSRFSVYDGFEAPALSGYWDTTKFLPGAVQIQSSVVRAGRRAASITLRPGDQIADEKGSELERAELREGRWRWSAADATYAYSFSLFLPEDFPIVDTRLVLAQWKECCPVDTCRPGNPVLAIRYQSGELFVAKQVTTEKEVLYRTADDVRNRWLDFHFQIRFSRSQRGRIRAWLGEHQIVDHEGVTAYPESGGYTRRDPFYFKVGLYRDRMSEPMTVFVDEYRKEPLPDESP